jgi:hypothetical protein
VFLCTAPVEEKMNRDTKATGGPAGTLDAPGLDPASGFYGVYSNWFIFAAGRGRISAKPQDAEPDRFGTTRRYLSGAPNISPNGELRPPGAALVIWT